MLHARLRRVTSFWSADLADRPAMARLRARTVVVLGTCGGLLVYAIKPSGLTAPLSRPDAVAAAVIAVIAVVVTRAAVRGPRTGDPEFACFMVLSYVMGTAVIRSLNGPGQVARTALSFVIGTVLAAVFLERTRYLVAVSAVMTALLTAVAWQEPAAQRPYDLTSGALSLVTMAVTVRMLRRRAIDALDAARRGEVTDPLTGLGNRRGLDRSGLAYWRGSARAGVQVAALVVDVDHFKNINDTQGHAAGDEVLRRLGRLLTAWLRPGDIAVRMGGEEFLVLCTTPPGHGWTVAERLRLVIERELAPITVSIGVYEASPQESDPASESLWSAVVSADRALYEAKAAGRNRVVLGGRGVDES